MKKCSRCGKQKVAGKFNRQSRAHDGLQSYCRQCQRSTIRERALSMLYGLTSEQYNSMLLAQGESCEICGKHQDEERRKLSVDHCHATGKIRGLTCTACNVVLGLVEDNPAILRAAARYIERFRAETPAPRVDNAA